MEDAKSPSPNAVFSVNDSDELPTLFVQFSVLNAKLNI